MSQTKKGNQWHFGMKLHVGADARSALSHSADISTASVHDAVLGDSLLHGAESIVFGDRGYASANRSLDAPREEHEVLWATPFNARRGRA